MASSSLSQEDLEADYETCVRRSRVRTARARNVNAAAAVVRAMDAADNNDDGLGTTGDEGHDVSPKPASCSRAKDKRGRGSNHVNKGKMQRDRRKLREKRRSTGIVHLPSTESTGGSTGEDEDELLCLSAETRRNTLHNELTDKENNISNARQEDNLSKAFTSLRNKSPSDLEADDEDNQDYDSTVNQSNSNASLSQECTSGTNWVRSNGRPQTPSTDNLEELLERAREENQNLLQLIESKDQKICKLEKEIARLNMEQEIAAAESEKLKEENKTLVLGSMQVPIE